MISNGTHANDKRIKKIPADIADPRRNARNRVLTARAMQMPSTGG